MSNEDTTKYIQGKLLQEHRRGLDAHYRTEIFTEHGVRVATVDLCPEDVPNGQVYLRGGTARRLVAAWNACRHLTTEQLEAGDLDYAGCSTLADIRTALGVGGEADVGGIGGDGWQAQAGAGRGGGGVASLPAFGRRWRG